MVLSHFREETRMKQDSLEQTVITILYSRTLVLFAVLYLSACTSHQIPFNYAGNLPDNIVITSDVPGVEARIHYLGVGGFAVEVAGHLAITAPFYSHLPWWKVVLPVSENRIRINDNFPPELRDSHEGPNVEVIVAGHAHYDHLMDVPYLMQQHLESATLVASVTGVTQVNQKLGLDCDDRSRVMPAQLNEWVSIGDHLRVYTLKASHAPHLSFPPITLMKGNRNCEKKPRLASPWGWKMGEPYAYLIDFLDDDGKILFRIFHQDSASDAQVVKIPAEMLESKRIDLATIVLAGFEKADRYPEAVVEETNASLYLVGHWESFFTARKIPIATPFSSLTDFVERLKPAVDKVGGKWLFMKPGASILLKTQ